MTQDDNERKRPHLRLVVNNPDARGKRPAAEENFIPFDELVAGLEEHRTAFYHELEGGQAAVYETLERFLAARRWPYALDPHHGRLLVLQTASVIPETVDHGGSPQDEVLLYVAEDATGSGLCLTGEMVLPYYHEDDAVMEEALLYAPIFQYGTLFLEENRQDGYLDLVYRLAFPLVPPDPTGPLLDRFFAVAVFEISLALGSLAEFPEG